MLGSMRPIRAKDVRDATGYTKPELRAVLKELKAWIPPAEAARSARPYTHIEVMVLAVMCELEKKFGFRRDALPSICEGLRTALSKPRELLPGARLHINPDPPSVIWEDEPRTVERGIVVPLKPVFDRVDGHLGIPPGSPIARPLLRATAVASKKKRSSG